MEEEVAFDASASVNFWPQQVARPSWFLFESEVQSKLTKSESTNVFVPADVIYYGNADLNVFLLAMSVIWAGVPVAFAQFKPGLHPC